MLTRRRLLSRGSAALLGTAGVCLALPGNDLTLPDQRPMPDGSASRDMIDAQTEKAIQRGLEYLRAGQNHNGSFGTRHYAGNTAITSVGALAFMAAGHQPNRGRYGEAILKALRFILSQERRGGHDGYLHNPQATPHGPMYGHGFATLFLAEVSGMVHDPELRKELDVKLHKAVQLIIGAQNTQGGWRYTPDSREADLSVTICQIMALRAARNAGIAVPKGTVDKCVDYVKRCQDPHGGWFRYMVQGGPRGGGLQAFARTAAGVAALNSAGIYKGREVEKGLNFLMANKPGDGFGGRGRFMIRPDMHYFYGHYYAVQVMWTAGGEFWNQWFPAIRDELIGTQLHDGSWQDMIDPHYATAMALLVLQVPNNYLPIMQK